MAPWRGQQSTGGTHHEQGTTAVIARLAQVSSRLPPRPQTFAVCPRCQPGRGAKEGEPSGLLGTHPVHLPTCLPGGALGAFTKPAQTADPAALGPGAGVRQPGAGITQRG